RDDEHVGDPDLGDLPGRPARHRGRGLAPRVRARRRRAGRRARGERAMSETGGRKQAELTEPAGRVGAASESSAGPVLAIVGATGAVGSTMIDIIDARPSVPWSRIKLVASPRSAGKVLRVRGVDVTVEALAPEVFDDVDIAL